MNRTIKFRAWDKKSQKMREVVQVVWGNRLNPYPLSVSFYDTLKPVLLENVKLMQFTGLHDKNGKEVYEGDVVKCSSGCPHEIVWGGGNGMPGWWLEGTIVGLMGDYSWMGEEEVIGNIYENPELLK